MQMLQMNVARFFFNSHKVMLDHISQKEKERKKSVKTNLKLTAGKIWKLLIQIIMTHVPIDMDW